MSLSVRRAGPDDAEAIADVMAVIAGERIHSAIVQAWSVESERRFLVSLSSRECVHVAADSAGRIADLQVLDLWARDLGSMAHVGQLGTFVRPEWRGKGVGRQLWTTSEAFARAAGYRKLVIMVRGSNRAAQAYYRRAGFQPCGVLSRQVVIDGVEDDEVMMELFLEL